MLRIVCWVALCALFSTADAASASVQLKISGTFHQLELFGGPVQASAMPATTLSFEIDAMFEDDGYYDQIAGGGRYWFVSATTSTIKINGALSSQPSHSPLGLFVSEGSSLYPSINITAFPDDFSLQLEFDGPVETNTLPKAGSFQTILPSSMARAYTSFYPSPGGYRVDYTDLSISSIQILDDPNSISYAPYLPWVDPVPEPATWAMMLLGFGAVGGTMRRKRWAGTPRLAAA